LIPLLTLMLTLGVPATAQARVGRDLTTIASAAGCPRGEETQIEVPDSLGQFQETGRPRIPVGGTARHEIMLQGNVYAVDQRASATLEVQVVAVGASFRHSDIISSPPIACGGTATIMLPGLSFGPYRWRAREVDSDMHVSRWRSFGANPKKAADFWLAR
jgi:hypothetical protein